MALVIWFIFTALALIASPSSGHQTKAKEEEYFKGKTVDVHDRVSLDKYLFKLVEGLRSQMHKGIPELNIPQMEPLKISTIVIDQGGGVAKLRAAFRNLEVYGLSNYITNYAKSNPENYHFSLGLKYDKLKISGDYEISGNLLLVPISGEGHFWSVLNNITADSYNNLEVINNKLRLVKTHTDFDIGRMRLRFDNLFDGDKFLGDTMNEFLNEQSQEIIREIKPRLAKEIDAIIVSVCGGTLSKLPVEKWENAIKKNKNDAR